MGVECKSYPSQSRFLIWSWSNEDFWPGLWCDLTPYNWDYIDISLSRNHSFVSAFGEDRLDDISSAENQAKENGPEGLGFSASRAAWSELSILAYSGIDWDMLDFTRDKALNWQSTDESGIAQDKPIRVSIVSLGLKFCALRFQRQGFALEWCYIPSFGSSGIEIGNTEPTSEIAYFLKEKRQASLRIPFTSLSFSMGITTYSFKEQLPENVSALELHTSTLSVNYRFGGFPDWGRSGRSLGQSGD